MKKGSGYLLAILVFTVLLIMGSFISISGYTDSSLYREKLEFDANGNLIMTTHDKKATTSVIYRTIGWVIKRYDMPKDAPGQQYAIIPIGNNVSYLDDPNSSLYVYCVYTGDKTTISNVIGNASSVWKNKLYSYGDYVYIDEIMTVVQNGNVCGGLKGTDGSYWGEVYFNYNGIANARSWASKESLRTHFDKEVYFPAQVTEKYFKKQVVSTSRLNIKHNPKNSLKIGEGNKYSSTYDVSQAVPTGSALYILGTVDPYVYSIEFEKKKVKFSVPIKVITSYTLKWKAYDGNIRTENKEVTDWYYVEKEVSYYDLMELSLSGLEKINVSNYAFAKNSVEYTINEKPAVRTVDYKDIDEHIKFPTYSDTLRINGGTLTQYNIPGVKPEIPSVNRQSEVNKLIGNISVRNDSLKIGSTRVVDSSWYTTNASMPYTGIIGSGERDVYLTGYIIPNDKENRLNVKSKANAIYKDYASENRTNYTIDGINSVGIHTPICISAEIEATDEEYFRVNAKTFGEHNSYKGYGTREYKGFVKEIRISFTEDVIRLSKNSDEEKISAGEYIIWNSTDKFKFENNTVNSMHGINIKAYAKNIPSYSYYVEDNYKENLANREVKNYIAYDYLEFELTPEPKEEGSEYEVVGTH